MLREQGAKEQEALQRCSKTISRAGSSYKYLYILKGIPTMCYGFLAVSGSLLLIVK